MTLAEQQWLKHQKVMAAIATFDFFTSRGYVFDLINENYYKPV